MKNIKTQIQAQRTPSMVYTTTSTPQTPHTWTHHIQTAGKGKDAEKILKAVRKKEKKTSITYRRIKIKIAKFLLSEIMQAS